MGVPLDRVAVDVATVSVVVGRPVAGVEAPVVPVAVDVATTIVELVAAARALVVETRIAADRVDGDLLPAATRRMISLRPHRRSQIR